MYQYTLEIVLGVMYVQYSTCIHEMMNIFRSKQKQIIIFLESEKPPWWANNKYDTSLINKHLAHIVHVYNMATHFVRKFEEIKGVIRSCKLTIQ